MSSDSEMSVFRGFLRISALAASFLSCPLYCENDCGTKVTSEVDVTYFGRAIQIPLILSLDFSNFGNVFLKANFKTKEKQLSVHRHFK